MALEKITKIISRGIFIPGNDIDTDQIIPARFMKCVTFDGLGKFIFSDAKAAEKIAGHIHPLDDVRFQGANILITGSNFGCGSSREHAPQSLFRYGFRAIIAESFAEIFFSNCTTLGIPCVIISKQEIATLVDFIKKNPSLQLSLDLIAQKLTVRDLGFVATFTIPKHARDALIHGRWDSIADLMEGIEDIKARVANLPYFVRK